jgi:hypothetical protein
MPAASIASWLAFPGTYTVSGWLRSRAASKRGRLMMCMNDPKIR